MKNKILLTLNHLWRLCHLVLYYGTDRRQGFHNVENRFRVIFKKKTVILPPDSITEPYPFRMPVVSDPTGFGSAQLQVVVASR